MINDSSSRRRRQEPDERASQPDGTAHSKDGVDGLNLQQRDHLLAQILEVGNSLHRNLNLDSLLQEMEKWSFCHK